MRRKQPPQDPRVANKVLEMVADHFKVSPAELKTPNGNKRARKVVMYILKEELGSSIKTAQEAVGEKWGPQVYAASKAIKPLLKTDTALSSVVEEIKTEVLMLTAMPDGSASTNAKPPTSPRRIESASPMTPTPPAQSEPPVSVATHVPTGNTAQALAQVQKGVTGIFLGAGLLQSADPAAEVLLAKDVVVFLVWDDFPRITQAELLQALHIDQNSLYRAIGRITATLRDNSGELKHKLKAARATYSAS